MMRLDFKEAMEQLIISYPSAKQVLLRQAYDVAIKVLDEKIKEIAWIENELKEEE